MRTFQREIPGHVRRTLLLQLRYGQICDNDPHVYQNCGVNPQPPFMRYTQEICGITICDAPDDVPRVALDIVGVSRDALCSTGATTCAIRSAIPEEGCTNIDINEDFCKVDNETVQTVDLGEGVYAPVLRLCNGRCDVNYLCNDEAFCGGYLYGRYCPHYEESRNVYIKPRDVCDGMEYSWCRSREDEENCPDLDKVPSIDRCQTTKFPFGEAEVAIINSTRCASIWYDNILLTSNRPSMIALCKNYMDQTNCSDPER